MQRVTTPTHDFLTNLNPAEWEEFRISYKQKGREVLVFTQDDTRVSISEEEGQYRISVRLTQKETRRFYAGAEVSIQIRCCYPSGFTIASDIVKTSVDDVLNHEILGGER